MEIFCYCICWGLPLFPSLSALLLNWIGFYNNLWCSYDKNHQKQETITNLTFNLSALSIIVYCYSAIIFKIKGNRTNIMHQKSFQTSTAFRRDVRIIIRMSGFVIAYAITWIPFFAMITVESVINVPPPYQYQIFVGVLTYSQGTSNFFLYFLNRHQKKAICDAIVHRFPSLRQKHFPDFKTSSSSLDNSPRPTPPPLPLTSLPLAPLILSPPTPTQRPISDCRNSSESSFPDTTSYPPAIVVSMPSSSPIFGSGDSLC
eukprot:Phypoly_transcript_11504.p1 GENE.Phypoly_transcript_11504~~Phypoly_transcript_11504.p1  ORF type:complete len:259 (+),score=26.57 Phypoly_transcript_11504:422-1198(+)